MTEIGDKLSREYLSERLSEGSSLDAIVQTWLDAYGSGLSGSQVQLEAADCVLREWGTRHEVLAPVLTPIPSSDIYVSGDTIVQIEGGFVWVDYSFVRLTCNGNMGEQLWLVYRFGQSGEVETFEEIGVAISIDVPKCESFMQVEVLYSKTFKDDCTLEFSSLASLKGTNCDHVQVVVNGSPIGYYVGL